MKFPFTVVPDLTDAELDRYHRHIDSDASGWHRRWTESIWRRHQHPSNAEKSGWKSERDQKRRIIHFYDEYGLEGRSFVLRRAWLSLQLSLPEEHIQEYRVAVRERLEQGDWRAEGTETFDGLRHAIWRRGDLIARIAECKVHPEQAKRGHMPPPGYAHYGLTLITDGYRLPDGWLERPWRVFFDVGLRKTLPRQAPTLVEPEALADYLPAQLELGCGPSIEAGIPHLSTLHRIYGVSHGDYGFVFRAAEDGALDVLSAPERKYAEMTAIYGACMRAGSTDFYRAMRDLHRSGHLVGPVITNNFDCQCADLGLPEISLRRYDWGPYYPVIEHDPRARSLLVVGVHADRRLVQMRARERGLKILFIDPEEYIAPDGRRISYPVEAPQERDRFVRATAQDAMTRLHRAVRRGAND
ncbi:hypothetical protein [Pendulispora albinea]|uniref:Deacetylase sirtuin-type domain-containing protein n=1 Tax=Pendulispora albinea TaxID=2741071 RepID=A0ABZ2LKH2_9BACT